MNTIYDTTAIAAMVCVQVGPSSVFNLRFFFCLY